MDKSTYHTRIGLRALGFINILVDENDGSVRAQYPLGGKVSVSGRRVSYQGEVPAQVRANLSRRLGVLCRLDKN